MLYKCLQQYSQYSFFDGMLKTSRVTLFVLIWEARLNLLSYSEGQMSTIIEDILMKFEGHLVMLVLIKGCGKNLISLSSPTIPKTRKPLAVINHTGHTNK